MIRNLVTDTGLEERCKCVCVFMRVNVCVFVYGGGYCPASRFSRLGNCRPRGLQVSLLSNYDP